MKNKKLIAVILSAIMSISQSGTSTLAKEKIISNSAINNKEVLTNKILQQENLKNNVIDILGFSNEKKFSIGFDMAKKEFKIDNQQNKHIHEYHTILNKVYFTIKVFDRNANEKISIELLGKDLGTTDKLDPLKTLKYEYGDIIKLSHLESGRLRIYGGVIDEREDYSDGIGNINNLRNVLFEITENGLKAIYLQVPTIAGVGNETIRQGTDFDLIKGVTAKDFLNNDITNKISIEGSVDKNTLGYYTIKYNVTDNWGNVQKVNRRITVVEKSKLEDNVINTCGVFWANPDFKIGFDDLKKEFKVFDQTSNVLHHGFGNVDFCSIRILDFSGKEKFLLKLKGTDTANSNKLDALKGFKYEYGDFIELWHKESSKNRIDGNIINAKHSYKDRIEPSDNVKFEITKEGLKAIYNEAPIIQGIEDITLKIGENFDPLNGVSVINDLDKNLVATVTGDVDKNNPGKYELTYTATNRFGKVTTNKRMITFRDFTNLEKNTINISNKNNELLAINFNSDSKTINLTRSNKNIRFNEKTGYFLKIKIYDIKGVEKLSIDILGEDNASSNKLDDLENFNFEYGDSVEFLQEKSIEGNNVKIKGHITGSKSDYSRGIDKNILNNSRFKITDTGLQAFYNEGPSILGADNITIKVGDIFNPLSNITVNDDKDNDLIPTVTGDVDSNLVGKYKLTYIVKDKEGKQGNVERIITVRSNEKPVILGVENSVIRVGDFFDSKLGIRANDTEDGDLTSSIKINGLVNLDEPAIYKLTYSVTDNDGNKSDIERNITVRSNDKPIITGINDSVIKVRDAFDDKLGIKASDTEDGDLTSLIEVSGEVKTDEIGVYTLVYSVTDNDGNKTSLSREVTVRSNDKPIITGINDATIKIGEIFNPLDRVSADDKEDGDITSNIKILGMVEIGSIGEYDLTYSVEDSDGNKVIEQRLVTVRSNDKPQITGNENTTIKVGDIFEPMVGVVAMDKEDGILTSAVKVKGQVDTSKEGIYDLIYSIIDKDNNESVVTRRVIVRSNTIPEFKGIEDIEIGFKKEFNNFKGVTAIDKEDGDLTNLIVVEGNVNSNISGIYKLSYKVIDNDGNEKAVIREIKVKEDERPNFNEVDNIIIKQGYDLDLMEGIVATDVKGNDITNNITIKGIVDTRVSGIYNIIYSVSDSDGNKRSISREITVQKDNSPTIIGIENISLNLGENFNPMTGVLGRDKDGNDLTSSIKVIGNVDNKIKGEYKLVYTLIDKDGNEQITSRTITIGENKEKGKEFFKDIVIKKHEEFDPLLGIEEVYEKNNIEVIGEVNKNEEGTYNLIYSITDKEGTKKSVTRKITVKEEEDPILVGVENITINAGETFDPVKGIQLNYNDKKEIIDMKNNLEVEGVVDTNKTGVYNLTYTIKNKEGHGKKINRTITVTNGEAPIIKGVDNVVVNKDKQFNSITGVVINDNKDKDLVNSMKINGDVKQKEGEYRVNYLVTDKDGNTTEITRVITVKDMNKDKSNIKNNSNSFIVLLGKHKYKIIGVIGIVLILALLVLFKRRKKEEDDDFEDFE